MNTPTPQLTAMQGLIKDLEIAIGRDLPKSIKDHYLAKEKQQIENAFDAGYFDYYPPQAKFDGNSETYYTQTYKTI